MALNDLLHRRVPQFVGAYIVAGWGVVQFIQMMETRYTLSPAWVELVGLGWILLLPAIVTLAWNHGAPGRDPWTRGQVISLVANGVTAVIILAFAFNYRDAEAATKTVSVEDENGATLTRDVPADESAARSLLSFFLETPDQGEAANHWYARGIPYLLETDLLQDLFLDVRSAYQNRKIAERLGASVYDIPRPMRRAIAERNHVDFYIEGTLLEIEPVKVEFCVVDPKTARVKAKNTFSGTVFSVADDASRWIRQSIELPPEHLERNQDLPIADMVTASTESLEAFIESNGLLVVEGDYAQAAKFSQKSVQADPTNAIAQYQLFS
ncbi:MAG: hypothetical protein AAFY60_21685, partial [Myxococcota bacterium]